MMFRGRLLTGIVLAVIVAGALGLGISLIFPTTAQTVTATSTAISSATTTLTSVTTYTTSAPTTTTTINSASSMVVTSESSTTTVSTSTSIVTTTFSTTTTATFTSSTTSACGTEYCGSLVSESPSLWSSNSSSAYATLTFTLVNDGNLNITSISILFNGEGVGQVSGIPSGQTVTYLIQLAPNADIVSGQLYQVNITSTTQYGAGPPVQFSVSAQ